MKVKMFKFKLIIGLVFVSLVLTSLSYAKLDIESAVAIWLFDEGAGDKASDSSGNGNDGNLTNGPEWVDGKFGKALKFDGVDDCVFVSSPIGLPTGPNARTISLWFKWSSVKWPSPGIEIMGYGANANSRRLGIWIDSSHALGIETCNYGRVFSWDGDTNWHHLAVVYPKGETSTDKFKLYFEGVLQSGKDIQAVQTLNTASSPLAIGVLPDPKVYYFNGIIDDVAIFNEVLSEEDIKNITKNGIANAAASVSPSGKLATAWGKIKNQY
jgi:hypothetical protein